MKGRQTIEISDLYINSGAPAPETRPNVYARRGSDLRRIRRRSRLKAFLILLVIALAFLSISGVGSYFRVAVIRTPFNWTASLGARVVGIPCDLTHRALNDGLLKEYVQNHSDMLTMHKWLRTENPSGVDYEYELRNAGWSNERIHALGSLFNVSEGPLS